MVMLRILYVHMYILYENQIKIWDFLHSFILKLITNFH